MPAKKDGVIGTTEVPEKPSARKNDPSAHAPLPSDRTVVEERDQEAELLKATPGKDLGAFVTRLAARVEAAYHQGSGFGRALANAMTREAQYITGNKALLTADELNTLADQKIAAIGALRLKVNHPDTLPLDKTAAEKELGELLG